MFQSPPTSVYNHISSIYHPYINHISSINGKIIIYHISYIIYHISHHYHLIVTMSFLPCHLQNTTRLPYHNTTFTIKSPKLSHPASACKSRSFSAASALTFCRCTYRRTTETSRRTPSRATGCCTQAAKSRVCNIL